MGIFDIFSTDDQQKAAADERAGLTQGFNQLSDLFNQGRNAISDLSGQGRSALSDLFNQGSSTLSDLSGQGRSALSDLFGQGRNAIGTNYAAALAPFTQNFNTATGGVNAYANASGANGGAGVADALKAFTDSPGYQFTLDQGNQNVLRNQAATGQLNSGATNVDLLKYGQGLAGTQFQNYVQNLLPFLNMSQNSAQGIGSVNTGQGNALNANLTGQGGAINSSLQGQGAALNTNLTNQGGAINSSLQGQGAALNANLVNQGNAAYGTQAGIGNANAQADLAGLTQSQNIIGGGLGLAGGLMGFLSDERAKDDIEPVGELFDGQKVYRYRYKGDDRHTIGLIAQEVEEARPSAVIHDFAGTKLKGVNYRRATDMAAELGKYLEAA
jgi:hypothetical protein